MKSKTLEIKAEAKEVEREMLSLVGDISAYTYQYVMNKRESQKKQMLELVITLTSAYKDLRNKVNSSNLFGYVDCVKYDEEILKRLKVSGLGGRNLL